MIITASINGRKQTFVVPAKDVEEKVRQLESQGYEIINIRYL